MPITSLDPNTALLVVDLQRGIVSYPTAHPIADVVSNAGALARAFRAHGLPVVLINVASGAPGRTEQPSRASGARPDGWMDFVPELDVQPSDHVVTKRTWGAFTATGLDEFLTSRGVTNVVVAGVATSIGAESTARQAHELGYNVTLALDAMTDMDADAHANSATRIFPRLGEIGTVHEIVEMLGTRRS